MRGDTFSLLFFACLVIAAQSGAGEIGIYANPDCSGCEITIPPLGGVDTLYVSVLNDGVPPLAYGTVCGAGFRISGLPDWWSVEVHPNPNAQSFGDIFGDSGGDLVFDWDGCSAERCVNLYTVVLTVIAPHDDVHLRVEAMSPPPRPDYDCPIVTTPDGPYDPHQCYPGGEILVNPLHDRCTVAVSPSSWTQVRNLYR